jgi:hypothetical protein
MIDYFYNLIMIDVIEKFEYLLLSKEYKLPCLVFCLFLFFKCAYL